MKNILGALVLFGLTMAGAEEAVAKDGVTTGTTSTKTDAGSEDDIDRVMGGMTDYNFQIMSWGYAAGNSNHIDVTFLAEFRLNTSNMLLCWTDTGSLPCWHNQVNVTGNNATPEWGYDWYQSDDATWINNLWWWQIDLDADTPIFTGWYDEYGDWVEPQLDVIECGVEYDFKLRNGVFNDTMTHTFPCQEEEEEEVCTECPYGGWYDGAHCTIGAAPIGSTAYIYEGYFAYMPLGGGGVCIKHDVNLRDGGCGVQLIPTDTDSFVLNNNYWYYDAVCE